MTVVAQGAAIFAGNQKLELSDTIFTDEIYRLELTQYERIGNDPEPFIAGRVIGSESNTVAGLGIEFKNQRWSSGLIKVADNGSFFTHLMAEPDIENFYDVHLVDPSGKPLTITPTQISYIIGNALAKQILIHSIGVALANNEVAPFLKKGEALPAKRKNTLYTSKNIQKADQGSILRMPIIEGENTKADRNVRIGYIDIHAKDISRDIPVGSEIELTIEVNESRLLRTMAYIPLIDLEIEQVHEFEKKKPEEPEVLDGWLFKEKNRLADLKEIIVQVGETSLLDEIWKIENQHNIENLQKEIAASKSDPDAAIQAERRILELRVAIDQLNDQLEWPLIKARADLEDRNLEYLLERIDDVQARKKRETLLAEVERAIYEKDKYTAMAKLNEMINLKMDLLWQLPERHHVIFDNLKLMQAKFRDQQRVEQLFAEGNLAIQKNDLKKLYEVNLQLINLLDEQDQKIVRAYGSSVMR